MIHAQKKGRAGEAELAATLREMGFTDAHRSARMYATGSECPDVAGIASVHIECKRTERLNLPAAMGQSIVDAAADEVPIVCSRRNRSPWMITLRLKDIVALHERLSTQQENQPEQPRSKRL